MKKLPALILFIFILFFFLVSPKCASATVLFQDDFDRNANGWIVLGLSGWNVTNGEYGIHVNSGVSNSVPSDALWNKDWVNYIYKVDLRGVYGTDKNVIFRFQNVVNFYEIHHTGGYIHFEKEIGGTRYSFGSVYHPLSNGPTYHFKIKIIGNHFEIYENNTLLFNVNDSGPSLVFGKIGLRVGTGAESPSEVWYDNIVVCDVEPCEPAPTLTPTPTPTLQPLILLPGLGASWNHEAMILDQEKPPEEWYMTAGVKSYDGIIRTFQNAGYTLGDNFFVFNYDWRQPIEVIAEDLRSYIVDNINPPPEEEIDLVGHSLGGIVARTYLQNHPSDHQVDQLITLGSPHHGVPQVYYLWEGADLNKTFGYAWQRIGAGILIQLKKRGFENNVETVQNVVPVIGNLLPDFPYLKEGGSPKSLNEMSQRNTWLENFNIIPLPEHLTQRLTSLLGRKGDTLRWIGIKPSDWLDQLVGRWEDGKPINEEFDMGDDSVLVASGQLEGAEIIAIEGLDHGDLVESVAGQQEIVNKLGLSPTSIVPAPESIAEPLLVFQLASPANISIYGPSGWQIGEGVTNNIPRGLYNPTDELIIIPNPLEGNYEVRVTGESGGGTYRLLIGNINQENDIWKEEGGQIGNGETRTHQIDYSSNVKENKLTLLNLAKNNLQEVKEKINHCRSPWKKLLQKTINVQIKQVEKIIFLYKKDKDKLAEIQLKGVIISLNYLEKSSKFWQMMCPGVNEDLLFSLREVKDYLLQALEL